MRGIVEVREIGDLGTVRRPVRTADRRTLRRLDRTRLSCRRVDDLETRRAARGEGANAVRPVVHLETAEVVVRFTELLNTRHALALELQEVLVVGTLVAERDVLLPRRGNDLLDRCRRPNERLFRQQVLERALLGDILGSQRNRYREERSHDDELWRADGRHHCNSRWAWRKTSGGAAAWCIYVDRCRLVEPERVVLHRCTAFTSRRRHRTPKLIASN